MKTELKQTPKEPERVHKEQVNIGILLPVLGCTAICLAVFVILLIFNSGDLKSTAQWANIAIMFLILPTLILGLILLAILIVGTSLSSQLKRVLPGKLKVVRVKALEINHSFQSVLLKFTSPVIGFKSVSAGIKSVLQPARKQKEQK